jgi:hypothetical protein
MVVNVMKRQMLSLFLTFLILLSVGGTVGVVGAAQASKSSSLAHGGYITDARAQQPTKLTFTAPSQAAAAGFSVHISLTTANGNGIPFAKINFQCLDRDRWTIFGSDNTDLFGNWDGQIKSRYAGEIHYRISYGGDFQYAPCVSNEVVVNLF